MKTEYHLIKVKNDFCNTVEQFKNLLMTNVQIKIDKDTVFLSDKSLAYSLKATDVSVKSKKETVFYFVLTTSSDNDEAAIILEKLDALLHRICDEHFTINTTWDDVSIYYAKKLYPLFVEVENLMRKIIYRFMIRIAGSNWFDNAVPIAVKNAVEEVQKKNKTNSKNADQLFYADFNQLGNFLFYKYTLQPFGQDFVEKLNKLFPNGEETIDKEKFKNLLNSYEAKSNWDRYFSDKIKVDGLEEKWNKLYSYRNQVAHTRRIKRKDFEEAKEIIDELSSAFNSCLDKIDTVNLTEEQSEAAQEFAKETVSQSRLNRMAGIISGLGVIADKASKLSLDPNIGLNPGINAFLNAISPVQDQSKWVFEPQSMLNISLDDITSRIGVNDLATSFNKIDLLGSTSEQLKQLTRPPIIDPFPTDVDNEKKSN